jgi:hypothetical protein
MKQLQTTRLDVESIMGWKLKRRKADEPRVLAPQIRIIQPDISFANDNLRLDNSLAIGVTIWYQDLLGYNLVG